MSLVKIYKYKIKPHTEEIYLELQEQVQNIYREYGEIEFTYLKDKKDFLKRTEIIRFFDENSSEVIAKIDSDKRILELFKKFSHEVLDAQIQITEEVLLDEPLSSSGKIHHVEIYCSDLNKSSEFWGWFLQELGYKQYQKWDQGISFKLADSYIVFVQAEAKYLDTKYHRCKPGLNHLAFHASSQKHIDQLTEKLKKKGVSILYPEKHPHAGGHESYSVFFEDPERIKVEVVAP